MEQFHVPVLFSVFVAIAVGSLVWGIYVRFTQNPITGIFYQKTASKFSWREQITEHVNEIYKRLPPWLVEFFTTADLDEMLFSAGRPFNLTAEEFTTIKLLAAGLALVLVLTAMTTHVFVLVVFIAIIKFPDYWLKRLVQSRQKKMDREFFNVASRLAAALAGGLTLDKALLWSIGVTDFEDYSHKGIDYAKMTPLAAELYRCLKETELGVSLDDAFSKLADRIGLLSARRMAISILQAKKGIAVSESLQEAVDDARERRKQTIIGQAKSAEKKSEIALFVMALPALIMTIAPMAISFMQQGGLGMF